MTDNVSGLTSERRQDLSECQYVSPPHPRGEVLLPGVSRAGEMLAHSDIDLSGSVPTDKDVEDLEMTLSFDSWTDRVRDEPPSIGGE